MIARKRSDQRKSFRAPAIIAQEIVSFLAERTMTDEGSAFACTSPYAPIWQRLRAQHGYGYSWFIPQRPQLPGNDRMTGCIGMIAIK